MLNAEKKENSIFCISCICIACLIIFINIMAGKQNYGMEGDEVFSYISSNSMGGFKGICFLTDQTWYEADYFKEAVSISEDERFNIKMVVENQAMDTHPPLYYILLNFVCSFFPGQFSRWFGIGLNIFFMLLVCIGLYRLLQYFIKNKYISLILSSIFCCSFLAINMVLFIRMYVLLMAIILFQTRYHLQIYVDFRDSESFLFKEHWKKYIVLMVITILGALTHYYFLIYQCLISILFILGIWKNKRYKNIFRYMVTMASSGLIYICLYPAAINHVFLKYRGREAVHKFLKEGTVFGAFQSMLEEFNEQLFHGFFFAAMAVLVLVTAIQLIKKKINAKTIVRGSILSLPLIIYFFGISKASPYVSIRYVSPIAALIYTVFIVWIIRIIESLGLKERLYKAGCILLCLMMLGSSFYFFQEPIKPDYYAERQKIVSEIAKDTDYCVYITGDEYNWKMWEDYINYPQFKGLYFIDGQKQAPITDEILQQQERLLIYIDNVLNLEEIYQYLEKYLPLNEYSVRYATSHTYLVEAIQ